jgi:hypothetical protein
MRRYYFYTYKLFPTSGGLTNKVSLAYRMKREFTISGAVTKWFNTALFAD